MENILCVCLPRIQTPPFSPYFFLSFSFFFFFFFFILYTNTLLKMAEHHDDDFEPSFTTGYKPGEKKTLEEYHTLDAGDESLNKWKQSLGLNQSGGGKSHDDDDDVNGGNERERGI
jgi:hypothetical protein